ncbi:ABC-three component system protein [Methanoregula sp. UBA64]|jgi:uncharacterized protein YydD (DUF2326 family)|uniref:ABC-three component system protein n=1 Tax=Methanoregula sp. UBA64 TaxID=1915554 RepID=UPI0025FE5415|nr:ABC-three component system protein [Methanoregula sp. UBA64]
MIYRILSDLPKFKNISLRPGMNIIVAEKSENSTLQSTRNKTGKTSLVDLINFIFGSNCDKNCIFRTELLEKATFSAEFDLKNEKVMVKRSGEDPNQFIVINETRNDPTLLNTGNPQEKTRSLSQWRDELGNSFFNLPIKPKKGKEKKKQPTFRSLFSYFARRENAGGILSHERQSEDQQTWDQQVAISFLLGLDWTISQEWQIIRDREKNLKELKKAVGEGAFGEILGKVSELRTTLVISEEKVASLEKDLESFKVIPEYDRYEKEATELTNLLSDIANENMLDRELISDLNISLKSEAPPSFENLERLYQEFGVIFPTKVSRRFEEVRKFHNTVIRNRKLYLQSETESAEKRILERNTQKEELILRRAKVLSILQSHGALDQFTRMHSDLIELQTETESLRRRYLAAEQLEGQKTELNIERNKLLSRLQQNFQEQDLLMKHIILTFKSISSQLYEDPGRLEITASNDGPKFDINIQGVKSKGIRNMQIFCFDMMMMILCQERGIGPGFLIHDSHVFDGVDAHQRATAFQVGAEMADKYNFQYIVTMNSCDMPMEYGNNVNDFNIEDYVLHVGITDAKDDGGLFGFKF